MPWQFNFVDDLSVWEFIDKSSNFSEFPRASPPKVVDESEITMPSSSGISPELQQPIFKRIQSGHLGALLDYL